MDIFNSNNTSLYRNSRSTSPSKTQRKFRSKSKNFY